MYNPGWVPINEAFYFNLKQTRFHVTSCDDDWNCQETSFESRDCSVSLLCKENVCTPSKEYQNCSMNEKKNHLYKLIGTACAMSLFILLCGLYCYKMVKAVFYQN